MIQVKKKIGIPQYRQIITAVEQAIFNGNLKRGDKLPSINIIKKENNLSRDTVLAALNDLKNRGIVKSIVGKGYYVNSENIKVKQKIFVLFDELNSFKEDLYNSFLEHLDKNIQVDIFFHHFNKDIFSKLIQENSGTYNFYVIMPGKFKNSNAIIGLLPQDKVYILDQVHEDLQHYSSVYQNFENSIYNNLKKANTLLEKYTKFILIYSEKKQPKGLLIGFIKYCEEYDISYEVLHKENEKILEKGELYIIPEDKSLLRIIKKMKRQNFTIAKDIGVISFNDTLLKEIVENGITTISTDFNHMGKKLAQMITNAEFNQIENPNHLIIRNSI